MHGRVLRFKKFARSALPCKRCAGRFKKRVESLRLHRGTLRDALRSSNRCARRRVLRPDLIQHDVANNGGLKPAEFRELIAPLGIAAAEKWRAEKTLQAFQCLFGFHEICTEHEHVRIIVFARELCNFDA